MKRLCVVLIVLAGCTRSPEGKKAEATSAGKEDLSLAAMTAGLPAEGQLMAEIITDLGSIRCKLHPEDAPETVASFVGLARGLRPWKDGAEWVKKPFYDGLLFHRVIPGFMIQGGDPLSRNPAAPDVGTGGPGYTLPDELSDKHSFDKPGVLAMANKGPRTHSGGSQFFITDAPVRRLDGGYVIFGECSGAEVVSAIASVPRDGNDRPEKPVAMQVKIYKQ
jgi:peptidyl-prolyl cis-trans isomerase A (cyclophilin A)